jgi:hypothetical protein
MDDTECRLSISKHVAMALYDSSSRDDQGARRSARCDFSNHRDRGRQHQLDSHLPPGSQRTAYDNGRSSVGAVLADR